MTNIRLFLRVRFHGLVCPLRCPAVETQRGRERRRHPEPTTRHGSKRGPPKTQPHNRAAHDCVRLLTAELLVLDWTRDGLACLR